MHTNAASSSGSSGGGKMNVVSTLQSDFSSTPLVMALQRWRKVVIQQILPLGCSTSARKAVFFPPLPIPCHVGFCRRKDVPFLHGCASEKQFIKPLGIFFCLIGWP